MVLLAGTGSLLSDYANALKGSPYDIAILLTKGTGADPRLPRDVKLFLHPPKHANLVIDVTLADREAKQLSLRELDRAYGPDTLILSNAFALPVSQQASWIAGKHRLLGVGLLPGFLDTESVEVSPSVHTLTGTVAAAQVFFQTLGKRMEIVQDRAGLVSARVICQIINEAAFALQDDVARPEDIDTSMKLGVSYPYGPFEWAARIGIDNVVAILQALSAEYQEERYRVAPLLQRMALGGVWWSTPTAAAHDGEMT